MVSCEKIFINVHYNSCSLLLDRYYQKVPDELPEIPKKEVFGLATPEDFTLPPHHQLWTEEVYAAFEVAEGQQEGTKYDSTVSYTKHSLKFSLSLLVCC